MNWKVKAVVQGAVSRLPAPARSRMYYGIQRACGTLRSVSPIDGFADGLRLAEAIEAAGQAVDDRTFLEVGTGRRLNVPIALWLCGAGPVCTVDRTAYLRPALVLRELAFVRQHPREVEALFGARARTEKFRRRFAVLLRDDLTMTALLDAARIRTPHHDVRTLPLPDRSVDFHISNNVMEHVPPPDLREILAEGARLVRDGGLLVHRVDFSDHFAEVDGGITTVNFLRYSERAWHRWAGNDFAFHNRLRIDEFEAIAAEAGLDVMARVPDVDPRALHALERGFPLDARFAGKPREVNATQSAVFTLRAPAKGGAVRTS